MPKPTEIVHTARTLVWSASLYGSTVFRVAVRAHGSVRRGNGRVAPGRQGRLVFVVGSPRSGTTFTASALGSQPGFVDLGETKPLKAAIPSLVDEPEEEASRAIRRTLETIGRLSRSLHLRGVEQTPETSFVLGAALRAFPEATAVHVIRDGRDVVASLLERGWLNAAGHGSDDVGSRFGAHPRFWVEPERREEFAHVSDAQRCAWAWRRYVTAARAVPERTIELRYELLAAEPQAAAERLAGRLDVAPDALVETFRAVHGRSLGRWRHDLTTEQLADVEREAGPLLRDLGYASG